jgi:ketosteroid isomerase-like protein
MDRTSIDTSRTVVAQLIAGVTGRAWDDLPVLYAEDAVVELPFALPVPLRLTGRDQIRAHFAAAATLPLEMAARNVVVHETADPEVVVAEFDYDGRIAATGQAFTLGNIMVVRVRDGRIVASRDYHNHAQLASIFAGLPGASHREERAFR